MDQRATTHVLGTSASSAACGTGNASSPSAGSTWPPPLAPSSSSTGASGGSTPDGAWRFLDTLSNEPNNLQFALQYNRIPIQVATAKSAAFHQNNPIKKLAGEQMEFRRWLIPAPGGTEASTLYNTLGPDVASGKVSARDALAGVERQIQQVLDKWKR